MRTFEAVTGPKLDRWLVKMVGLLATATGVALAVGLRREQISAESRVLAVATAASFCMIDTVYAVNGRISRIYLADAAVEMALIAALLAFPGNTSG